MRISRFAVIVGAAAALALGACASDPKTLQCATGIECPSGTICAAVQPICLTTQCGNGIVDPGEECDDGNIVDGDGCSFDCKVESCGNGIVDPNELCDDGNAFNGACSDNGKPCNADSDCNSGVVCHPDSCSHDCQSLQTCGNGVVDLGEICDDGGTANGTCDSGALCNADTDCAPGKCHPDGCSANCKSNETCGNGVLDVGEVCDPGISSACESNCLSSQGCGNGVVDTNAGEQCDDGNTTAGDGCGPTCLYEQCGNNFLDPGEECDGTANTTGFACSASCKAEKCGNGVLDPGEQCDDGNASNTDDCISSNPAPTSCKVAFCGDGFVDSTGAHKEDCDAGVGGFAVQTATCNIDCTTARCGDGKVNPLNKAAPATAAGEECDDGNNVNGDGCDNNCTLSVCGNGVVDPGEECDDGNGVNDDGCDNNCTHSGCGNGILEGSEQCDDGNNTNGDGCSATCKLERCGNGIVDPGEECDDPAGNSNTGACTLGCKLAKCGDGLVEAGVEDCDDGNTTDDGNGCSTTCKKNSVCGNNKVESLFETCDDGNTVDDHNGCSADCHQNSVCGDGHIQSLYEQCDDGNTTDDGNGCSADCRKNSVCGNGKVESLFEQCDGGPGCSADCKLETCGNGIVDPLEECDNGAANSDNGPCTTACKFNRCGDGKQWIGVEDCDDPLGNSFTGTCLPTCKVASCGDGFVEAGVEDCDDGPLGDIGQGCSATCHKNSVCGNGIFESDFEQCDPGLGPNTNGPTCDKDCTLVVCGDGLTNGAAGEVCDDGNALACGTCSANCKVVQLARSATGTITIVDGTTLNKATFTLVDGFGGTTTFEFRSDGGHTGSDAVIVFNASDSLDTIADTTAAKINSIGAGLAIAAVHTSPSADVDLTNTNKSSLGNQTIGTSGSASFTATDMSGGQAGDCLAGNGCSVDGDCKSGTCLLTNHTCL